VIGIQYVVTSFFFLFVGGPAGDAHARRARLPGRQFVDANTFNGLFSVHASLLIFLFVIPVFAGAGELRAAADDRRAGHGLPAPERAVVLDAAGRRHDDAAVVPGPGGSFASGWTAYAPLSTSAPIGQEFFTIGVQFAGASSIATALNFLVTIITMRAPGMSFFRLPLLVWANFSTSLLVVIATPFIAASQFFVLLDRALGFNFFDRGQGGDVLMYQHVFWFYSHPASTS
jgi:cytochrome c oxidase subunit 1